MTAYRPGSMEQLYAEIWFGVVRFRQIMTGRLPRRRWWER